MQEEYSHIRLYLFGFFSLFGIGIWRGLLLRKETTTFRVVRYPLNV